MTKTEFNPNMTLEEIGEKLLNEHLERCRKKIARFRELQKEKNEIRARDVSDELQFSFDTFLGDVNYLFHKAPDQAIKKIAFDYINRLGFELEFNLNRNDDIGAFYLMDRIVHFLGFFVEEIQNAPKESRKDKAVPLYISCCRSESTHECLEQGEIVSSPEIDEAFKAKLEEAAKEVTKCE